MKIGIIADTHDNFSNTQKAVEKFNSLSIPMIIHAGDIISPFAVRILSRLTGKFIGIYGNCDVDKNALKNTISKFGKIENPPFFTEIGGLNFCIIHEHFLINKISRNPSVDVIIYGHLHKPDVRNGKPLVINPGECCSHLTGKATVAILDTANLNVEILTL